MKEPKKIYPTPLDCAQLEKLSIRGLKQVEYISVDQLRAWISEHTQTTNMSYAEIIFVHTDELLKFIDE